MTKQKVLMNTIRYTYTYARSIFSIQKINNIYVLYPANGYIFVNFATVRYSIARQTKMKFKRNKLSKFLEEKLVSKNENCDKNEAMYKSTVSNSTTTTFNDLLMMA